MLDRPPTASVTRRQLVLGGLAVGAAIVVPGCGSDGEDPAATTVAGPGFPRTVSHALGTTRIEARPRRVVALDPDQVLALDVTPVAMGGWNEVTGVAPWAREAIAETRPPLVNGVEGVDYDFEKIAAARPDLILQTYADASSREEYERFTQIAPTVGGGPKGWLEPWQVPLRLTGRALGLERPAEREIAAAERHLDAFGREHPQLRGATYTYAWMGLDGVYVLGGESPALRTLAEIGMVRSDRVPEEPGGWASLSLERLDLLEADVLLASYATESERRRIEEMPLFQRLPAVRRGAYVPFEITVARALVNGTVLSLPWALDRLVPRIARALA